MATANAVSYETTSALQGIYRRTWQRITVQLKHHTAMMYGDYLEAARLRAKHAFLRLAGPKGKLP